ncbi:MAG: COX15/CtaA family protein [Flavobacteriales bacterium]|nr:COX15/CtaA family protein [Flavobacteriales bacterium]
METGPDPKLRLVRSWLLAGCMLIGFMVVIGGITRLTGSGLSITEWKPIMGALPPMSDVEWIEAFKKYQAIPEYRLLNSHMGLQDFKRIYFWEWLHRNWGRLMGLVFLVPFMVFWRKGLLKDWLMRRLLWVMLGGAIVGSLGWFMVQSGLTDQRDANGQLLVSVSHYRLAIHLGAALIVFALVWWTWLDLRSGRRRSRGDGSAAGSAARGLLVLLFLQIIWGALTAGLDAGRSYNTWPLMNGVVMPENVTAFDSMWQNFTGHQDGVQFVHRWFAWVVAAAFVWLAVRHRGHACIGAMRAWLIGGVLLQFALGVVTILTRVHIVPGVAHQFGALVLLAILLVAIHGTGAKAGASS